MTEKWSVAIIDMNYMLDEKSMPDNKLVRERCKN